jgi:hypothetical protein
MDRPEGGKESGSGWLPMMQSGTRCLRRQRDALLQYRPLPARAHGDTRRNHPRLNRRSETYFWRASEVVAAVFAAASTSAPFIRTV